MSPLASIVRKIAIPEDGIEINLAEIAKGIVPEILADPEASSQAVFEAARTRIKARLTKMRRHENGRDARQVSFFGALRVRYALDVDEKVLKDTQSLTRIEFQRIITIRRTQIADDRAHLALLERAATELAPLWDAYPMKTFGEVEQMYVQGQGRNAA